LLGRVSTPLAEDCSHFRPVAGAYSPYGVLYGFASDLVEHMAFKTLQPDAATRSWVNGWRQLPHLSRDVTRQFDYPQQFAEDIFDRIELALRRRVSDRE